MQDGREAYPGLADYDALLLIEGDEPVETLRFDESATVVEATVPV